LVEAHIRREKDPLAVEGGIVPLWKLSPKAAGPHILRLLHSRGPVNKRAIISDLGRSGRREAIPILRPFLSGRLRFDAAVALSALGVQASDLNGVPEEAQRSFPRLLSDDKMKMADLVTRTNSTAGWVSAIRERAQLDRDRDVRSFTAPVARDARRSR
jgi:hypothetical protein